MATSFLDSLYGLLTPDLLSGASTALGESESAVTKGLRAGLPALLLALADRSHDTSLMERLLGLANDPSLDTRVLSSPARALDAIGAGASPRSPGLASLAAALVPLALGDRAGGLGTALARYAGLRNPGSATSLLSLAAPLVLGLLRDRVQRDGMGAAGLGRWLGSQSDVLRAAVPAGLERPAATRVAAPPPAPARRPAWLVPVLLLLGLGALWALLRGREAPEVARAPTQVESPPAVGAAPPAPEAVTGEWRVTLPNGASLEVPEDSLEAQLARFAQSNRPVDETTWFDFDRLLFETGSARLRPESRPQLANVALILEAYPALRVKIGGYTDDTGDAAANQELSQARADSVRNELTSLGIAPERLVAEGYGEQHPVADNATEEGRAQNRRIAMLVLEK